MSMLQFPRHDLIWHPDPQHQDGLTKDGMRGFSLQNGVRLAGITAKASNIRAGEIDTGLPSTIHSQR